MVIELIMIAFIICFITDISGVTDTYRLVLYKLITGSYKGFNPDKVNLPKIMYCSLCQTWWAGLIYLTITSNISIYGIFIVALLSMLTESITHILELIKHIILSTTSKLYYKFDINNE